MLLQEALKVVKKTIEKEHYGNVKLEEEDNENDFCNVTSIFNEEKMYPFRCDECAEQFLLNSHMKTHKMTHIAIKVISCDVCKKEYTNIREFQEQWIFESLKVLKDGTIEDRIFLAELKQNFIFQVF